MTEKSSSLIDEYRDTRPLYDQYSNRVKQLITLLVEDCGFAVHSITSRTKEIESLDGKIWRKKEKYDKLSDITDLSGIRIICYLLDQVDKVADIIEDNFSINYDLSIDKRQMLESDRFGYLSLHYVATLSEKREKLDEYKKFKGMACEIQIRSILQHSWAEIEHDLGYKSSVEVPKGIKRRFYRLAGLLELADDEFNRLNADIISYEKTISSKVLSEDEAVLIDKNSLKQFVVQPFLNNLNLEISNLMKSKLETDDTFDLSTEINILNFLNITHLKHLSELLISNRDNILSFVAEWKISSEGDSFVDSGISLFYLGYVLIGKTQDRAKVAEYLKILSSAYLDEEESAPLIEKIIHICKDFE